MGATGPSLKPVIYSTPNVGNLWPQEWHVGLAGASTPEVFEPIVQTLYTPKRQFFGGVLKCKIWALLHGYGWLANPPS